MHFKVKKKPSNWRIQAGFASQEWCVYAFRVNLERENPMLGIQKEKNKPGVTICSGICLSVLLTSLWALAQAQIHSDATGDKESAHIKRDPDADTARFIVEQEIPTKMQLPEIQFNACQASITLQYHQRNTMARVESTIENESCTTSTGEYELLVNIVGENGASQNLPFGETWEQQDEAPVKISRDYPIGDNVTLKRIVARGIRCQCTDPSTK